MHREIEEFLKRNTYDQDTRWGIVNEGESLKRALEDCNYDESRFLRDIDEYSFFAANGKVNLRYKNTRTFLKVDEFSFYYKHDHYVHHLEGGEEILTDRVLWDHEPEILYSTSTASGSVYIFSDISDVQKQGILKYVESKILSECRGHFGRW